MAYYFPGSQAHAALMAGVAVMTPTSNRPRNRRVHQSHKYQPSRAKGPETASLHAYLVGLERSLEFDDDDIFCPGLVVADDVSLYSSGSEASSLASNSPHRSPMQAVQVVDQYAFHHFMYEEVKPARARKPIPIVHPETGLAMPSPSPSPPRNMGR